MPGSVSRRSSDSVSSYVSADDSSEDSVYHDVASSVSRRNSNASEFYVAGSIVSGSDVGLSDLDASEPSKVAKFISFVFPKISCFKQAYAEPRNEGIADEGAETERWNDQIEATIEELRKQPKMQELPLNVSAESPSLLVSVPAAISEGADGGGEAAELPPQGHDVEAVKGLFNTDVFPHFSAEIKLVRDTLDNTNLNVEEKIATLITLKKKTFPRTVKLMNLAEIMRDTARHESYEPVDRNQEKEEKLGLGKEAVEKSELELATCQHSYEEQKGLLDELLGLQQPFNREQLVDLHRRYLEVSGDKPLVTTFEKFVIALYDDPNQYLQALNDLVTESRNKIIAALERLDEAKADCTSEFEYDWFTSSNSLEVFTNKFMNRYKQINGSWNNTYFGDLSHWISDQLKDKSQHPVKRFGVIALQVASVGLYIIAKLAQTVGAPIAAFLAASSAVAGHVIYRLVRFLTYKPYKWCQRKIDAPKDEEQANKTRIADPARKLNITTHLLDNPITSAVESVAPPLIKALKRRKKGVRIIKRRTKVTLTPPVAALLNPELLRSHFREADLAPTSQVEHRREDLSSTSLASNASALASAVQTSVLPRLDNLLVSETAALFWEDSNREAFTETEKKYEQVRQGRKPRQDSSGLGSSGSVTIQTPTVAQPRKLFAQGAQRHNGALTRGMTEKEITESRENLGFQSGGAAVAASQGTSLRTKIHDFVTGHSSRSTFSHPKTYTLEECAELTRGMRSTNPRT